MAGGTGGRGFTLAPESTPFLFALEAANHLLRSGTSPYANHAEAQAAESRTDFIYKLRICLKELRESKRWIMLIQEAALLNQAERVKDTLLECEELIKILVTSIRTAESKKKRTNVGR